MGGPCRLRATAEVLPDGRTVHRLISAPACTDNFQIAPFNFDGTEWQSCEQCYQAMKFVSPESRDCIRRIIQWPEETDRAHGMRSWHEGQRLSDVREDWNAVKVEVMLRVNRAKYAQNPQLQRELVATGTAKIVGSPSTSWKLQDGTTVNWSHWNGLIQMRIRAELSLASAARGPHPRIGARETLREIAELFDRYMSSEGGQKMPIPDAALVMPSPSPSQLEPVVHAVVKESDDASNGGEQHMSNMDNNMYM